MSDYYKQRVEIMINKDSDEYRRMAARAARDGVKMENIVDVLFTMGLRKFLRDGLDRWDEMDGK